MRAVGTKLAFEVLEFTATPGSPDVAVLQLEGRFRAPGRRRLGPPRLLVENAEERIEVPAADGGDALADVDGAHWRGSFAVPLRILAGAEYALAVGRELLDLPVPDRDEGVNGVSDLHVRLAREANALRALADEAREAAATALGRADAERSQRERLQAEMRGERHAREELATRLSQFEAELAARDEALAQAERDHEAALAAREAEIRAEAEAEAAELRRALKNARAEIELLRRERDRAAVQRAEQPAAATRVAAEPSTHPEQDVAAPSLPLPEGEEIGPVRPAATNGDGPDHDEDDDYVPPPTTVAGGRVPVDEDEDEDLEDEDDERDDDDDGDEVDAESWTEDEESEGVRVLGRRRPRSRKAEAPPADPLPGTAAIGARHIVPGDMGPSRLGPWIARGAAVLALAFVIVAVLLVMLGMR